MTKDNSTTCKYTVSEIQQGRGNTDWQRLKAMGDDDIDTSEIEIQSGEFWQRVEHYLQPSAKKPLTLRLEGDLIQWFKDQGGAYQTHMAAVLKAYRDMRETALNRTFPLPAEKDASHYSLHESPPTPYTRPKFRPDDDK